MQNLREPLKYLLFALLVLGLGMALYGGYRFYEADQQIKDIDEQLHGLEAQVSDASSLELNPLAAADIALRRQRIEHRNERDEALRLLGTGIALVGGVWLLWEILLPRLRPRSGEARPSDEGAPS